MIHKALSALLLCAFTLTAQAEEAVAVFGDESARPMLFRSTTDIRVLGPTIEEFVRLNPDVHVIYEQWGSNALFAESQKDCEAGTGADAILSSAVHQLVSLVNTACAAPYRSPLTEALPNDRRWRDELWGITREAAVIIYNTALLPEEDVPHSRFELLDLMRQDNPAYEDRIATYDVEASGLGYLFAFSDSIEASTFGALLEGFSRVDAVATCCSNEIIEGVSSGRYLIAYNVLGSYVSTQYRDNVSVVMPEDYTLFLSRAYMIPRNSQNQGAATRLLDFLLSSQGNALLQESGLVMRRDPEETFLPESSERAIPINPMLLVALDQHRRKRFIAQWRSTFGAPQFLSP